MSRTRKGGIGERHGRREGCCGEWMALARGWAGRGTGHVRYGTGHVSTALVLQVKLVDLRAPTYGRGVSSCKVRAGFTTPGWTARTTVMTKLIFVYPRYMSLHATWVLLGGACLFLFIVIITNDSSHDDDTFLFRCGGDEYQDISHSYSLSVMKKQVLDSQTKRRI